MGAVRYQVLYRYMNEATNTPITNSMDNSYEETLEFYTDDHKIYTGTDEVKAEAEIEKEEMISYGNMADNPKTNMLFAYAGTKKIKHSKWVPETTGWVVRDWRSLDRNIIGNQGDFTKEFTTIDAATPEDGGTVVCTEDVFRKYFTSTITVTKNGDYTEQEINKMITESTMFKLNTSSYKEHGMEPNYVEDYGYYGWDVIKRIPTGPVFIGDAVDRKTTISYYTHHTSNVSTCIGCVSKENVYSQIRVTAEQVETTTIPGHYEEVTSYPYAIKDTYERIKLSPWFVNCTCGSLQKALDRAKVLADMIGIDNVKVIKTVPFDQFIKIK